MHSILVKDYMDSNHHAITERANVVDAIGTLLKHSIPSAPVIDKDQRIVGYITEQDCIAEMLNDAFYCEEPGSITKVMTQNVAPIDPQSSIVEIAQGMLKDHHTHYPVVDNGKLIGVISRSRILKALVDNDDDCYLRH